MSQTKRKKKSKKRLIVMRKQSLLPLLLCMLLSLSASAQGIIITGQVTSTDGQGLPGANVVQKGTVNGTVTDFDGNYTITLVNDKEAILLFSYIGFQSKEQKVGGTNQIDVSLIEDSEALSDVVVIGYAAIDRKNILGAVSSIKQDEITQVTPVSAFDAIQGRLSGVQIATDGAPGSGSQITIRGLSTFNAGTGPLYVVDGQQLDNIDNLDPDSIADIQVLKDAATAAIYGSRSANGVIVITTKSGQEGKAKIDVSHATTYSFVSRKLPLANSKERLFYELNSRKLGDQDPNKVEFLRDSLSLLTQNSFDLQDLLTRPAVRSQVNIAISGGNQIAKVYWNSGFLEEKGLVLNSGYKRINTQINANVNLNSKLTAATRLQGSFEDQKGLSENGVFLQMSQRVPYFPIFEPDGSLTPTLFGRANPIAQALERTLDDRNFRARSFSDLKYKILPSLAFKTSFGVNFRLQKRNEFAPTILQNRTNQLGTGRERNTLSYDFLYENVLTYKEKFGEHTLNAIVGTSLQKWRTERTELGSRNFLNDVVETFNNVEEFRLDQTETFFTAHSLYSLFGQLSYDYKGKYLLGGTIRRDGSSRFGDENVFGNFPSVSAGWRISSESFVSDNIPAINNLMLRASYGLTGNQEIEDFLSERLYEPGAFYGGVNGIRPIQFGNKGIKWETTTSTNLGINLGLFDNRLTAAIDVYKKETEDLLYEVNIAPESGFDEAIKNLGRIENKGIDLEIGGTPIKTANFAWNSNLNLSFTKNEVIEVENDRFIAADHYLIEEGQPIGNFYGLKNLGIFQYDESNAFDDSGVQLTPVIDGTTQLPIAGQYTRNGQPYTGTINQLKFGNTVLLGGDIIWDDVNKDFQIEAEKDRQVIGNGLPTVFGGFFNEFKYKNFSVSFLFDYTFGHDIWAEYNQKRDDGNSGNETPSPIRIKGAWSTPGQIAKYPILERIRSQNKGFNTGNANNPLPQSAYIEDGDFIKLRNVRFNYRLSPDLLDKITWLKSFSMNLSINNLATWTKYTGFNPELRSRENLEPGRDNLRYPNKTQIILGLRAGL